MKKVLISKESAPLQAGKFTTAQTLIALGKSHAILDLYCVLRGFYVYDYVGISPATTHSYLKKLNNWDSKHPVQKEDILAFLQQEYKVGNISLDESDAVFLAITLIGVHWNKQIDEEIREVKRHKKTLKAKHAIQSCDDRISELLILKI